MESYKEHIDIDNQAKWNQNQTDPPNTLRKQFPKTNEQTKHEHHIDHT